MANSINGWPIVKAGLTSLPQVTGKVLTGPVWVVFYWLCRQYAAHVEPINKTWSWGWSYRKVAGSKKWSNHASGTAVDFNAPLHGAGKVGTFKSAQRAAVELIVKSSRGVLRWGHLFKDEMHFELAPGVTPAQVQQFAAQLLQHALSDAGHNPGPLDGIIGPKTSAALRAFRTAKALPDCHWTAPQLWAVLAP